MASDERTVKDSNADKQQESLATRSTFRSRTRKGAFLALGFRPFFLLAAVIASMLLLLWILELEGLPSVGGRYGAVGWHAHEMIFGYTVAVIAGFLLTAVRNWTRLPTASGGRLAALVGLWLAGRLVMLGAGLLPTITVAIVDIAFLPLLAASLIPSLWRAQAWRNLTLIGLIGILALANLEVHLGALTMMSAGAQLGQRLGLAAIVMMMVVVGGRVIPAFTRNALPQLEVRSWAWVDRLAIALTLFYLVSVLLPIGGRVSGVIELAAGITLGIRMVPWRSFGTRGAPILWVLHLGYAWIAVGLILSGAAVLIPEMPTSAGTHALGVGAIGTLTLGMMSRVALGHTGRALVVRSPIVWAYGLVTLAAAVRVAAAFFPAQFVLLIIAGLAWASAFAMFAAIYWPILVRPRADGRPG
jgi:uncharacterized protein involved in response to NO